MCVVPLPSNSDLSRIIKCFNKGIPKKHKPINLHFPLLGRGTTQGILYELWSYWVLSVHPLPKVQQKSHYVWRRDTSQVVQNWFHPHFHKNGPLLQLGLCIGFNWGYISFKATGQVTPLVGYSQEINSRVQPLGGPIVAILFIENSWQK